MLFLAFFVVDTSLLFIKKKKELNDITNAFFLLYIYLE